MGGVRTKSKSQRKKQPKNILLRIFRVRAWKLILIAILLAFISATLLRFDHVKMNNLKAEVLTADKEGDEEVLAEKINNLRNFVTTHIVFNVVDHNGAQEVVFGTGSFYLEETYRRTAESEIKKAQEAISSGNGQTNPNGNVYAKVADICDAKSRRYGWGFNQAYMNCWTEELAKYPGMTSVGVIEQASIPDTALYYRNYASPIWYPCLSGFSILLCVTCLIWALIRIVFWIVAKIALFIIDKIDK